ncbi:fimbrial protein [Citrobacter arsenatis]|uniref:fimbrial protein n=1 Tax=Citrobacter arsenatis TaxID=2546350 RepID=UPI00300DDB76
MKSNLILRILAVLIFLGITSSARAEECTASSVKPINMTVSSTITLPQTAVTATPGTVLYIKESSLSALSGIHSPVTPCMKHLTSMLQSHITGSHSGNNIIATALPGLGLRITVILNKAGLPHKEWELPFNISLNHVQSQALTTDDFRIRIEAIKTGEIQGETLMLHFPALLSLDGNTLVVNLSLTIIVAKAHCAIEVVRPQISLPPVTTRELLQYKPIATTPLAVSLHCLNTRRTSISVEGITSTENTNAFSNMEKENPAEGVGISISYNDRVMPPNTPMDILLPTSQETYILPLAARYIRIGKKIKGGKLKTQITLRINYL